MCKFDIYIKMLELILPYVRCVQTWSKKERANDRSCYYDVELIHNLAGTLKEPGFEMQDIWFLNNQARVYFENCNENISPNYNQNLIYIKELFSIVPLALRCELTWEGP